MDVRCSIGDFFSLASLINLVDYSDILVLFLINIQCVYSFSKIITRVLQSVVTNVVMLKAKIFTEIINKKKSLEKVKKFCL